MPDRPREKAICLYAGDFSETSQVAHFFARESGVVHLLAKGSKRSKSKTGGALDLLSEGDLVFIPPRAEAMGTLIEFTESVSHSALRRRLDALNAALYMAEVTAMLLAEQDPHPGVFDLLSAALRRLDKPGAAVAPAQAVLAYYQWRLLRQVGLLGEMDACVGCGAPAGRGVQFSSYAGGLLCPPCRASYSQAGPRAAPPGRGRGGMARVGEAGPSSLDLVSASPAALAGLAALRAMDRRQKALLPEDQAAAVNALLAYHLSYQLGRRPKMLRYVRPAPRKP